MIVRVWIICGLCMPSLVWSSQIADQAYEAGNYEAAMHGYYKALLDAPEDARLHYNLGNTLYQQGLWADAIDAYSTALRSGMPSLQANAYFNNADARYRMGAELEDLAAKKEQWEAALLDYERAFGLDPDDEDARKNYAFVKEQLDQLPEPPPEESSSESESDSEDDSSESDTENPSSGSDDQEHSDSEPSETDNQSGKDEDTSEDRQDDASSEPEPDTGPEGSHSDSDKGGAENIEPQPEPISLEQEEALRLLQALEGEGRMWPGLLVQGESDNVDRDW